MTRRRGPAWLVAVVALPVLVALLGLGWWQLQRMHWKNGLVAAIAASEQAPPVPLDDPPRPYVKVIVEGRFRHDLESFLKLEVRGPVLGAQLVVPLEREGAPPILVDRGWVPLDRRDSPIFHPPGVVSVTGWVHPGERPGMFAAEDDPVGRRFYTFDPPAIGAALGLPSVAPYAIVALGGAAPMLPDPARSLPRPSNNHLGYVITWWGLAGALLGVLGVLAWRRRRTAPKE
ncbi:SURF1 family protein [Humitalea sp. 24SJ18S-53]|uniref:SURF1 family protein n=1 Tax=Humitalea sp. 24SJ18S-53 TaxID=3422307 RepID=UPI003D67CC2A